MDEGSLPGGRGLRRSRFWNRKYGLRKWTLGSKQCVPLSEHTFWMCSHHHLDGDEVYRREVTSAVSG
jgi:hypothetical protein